MPIVERTRARENYNRWGTALELLQSQHLSTRVSGIYALESLAREDASAREGTIDVLCALVRRQTPSTHGASPHLARVPHDVQAALAVLGRCARSEGAHPLDLHGISLRAAFLPGANLAGAFLYDCDLEGALLPAADLRGAWLWRAHLKRVNLDDADLRGADLSGALGLKREQIEAAICDAQTRLPTLDE